ncbi:TonB-dependent receptor domain-containing protein [Pusillimonas sp. ANT_WB101]|uniref:TonB-dependent receptor family protein n=1 Tax=Pusillimonas sp. ANT_WB101 TaxID=2597356 RepID=UPI0011EDA8BB|nr:TonB-dependent receptor [Pusillimonas sp. ANT_WB101]KAA0890758.1 TonB-dependent receptor [Pusillimonas sp. ANT_WB101]
MFMKQWPAGFGMLCIWVVASQLIVSGAQAETGSERASQLDIIVITPERMSKAIRVDDVREALRSVPGNVSVIDGEDYSERTVTSLSDALWGVPGVRAPSGSGQESARVSIRGSGLSSGGVRGLRLLRDGLPLGRLDDLGDSIYADPAGADYMEVFRGANAMGLGVATLGGAINLVSPTGYSRPGVTLRVDGGTHGYAKGAATIGEVFDNGLDFYASASTFHSNGAREHSAQTLSRFYGNVGYRFSPTSRGRLHMTREFYKVEMPGPLTRSQLQNDPSQANADYVVADSRIRTHPRWHTAYVHELDLGGDDHLSLGAFHTGTKFVSPGTGYVSHYDATDYGVSWRHEINRRPGGRDNQFVWGGNLGRGRSHDAATWPDYLAPLPFPLSANLATLDAKRANLELFAENTYWARPDLALIVGAQATRVWRRTDNHVAPLAAAYFPDGSATARYSGLSPRLGIVWDVASDAQVFANVSRSYEPPNSLNFYTFEGLLKAQRATTAELGTRGGSDDLGWELAAYHSWVRDEILLAADAGNPYLPARAHNARATRHMGLELGIHGRWRPTGLPGYLDWRLAYTWSRFRFYDDAVYGNNAIPGVPPHMAQLTMLYRHPSGFYAGPGIETASGWYVDQANSVKAPGYGVVNFTMGYEAPDGKYRVALDGRNLTGKRYAAMTEYVLDARKMGDKRYFTPGQQRAVFLSLQMGF